MQQRSNLRNRWITSTHDVTVKNNKDHPSNRIIIGSIFLLGDKNVLFTSGVFIQIYHFAIYFRKMF